MADNRKRPLRWRIGDAVDEFAHRRLGFGMAGRLGHMRCRWYWRLTPFPLICNRRELSYGVPYEVVYPGATTSNANAYTVNHWTFWPMRGHSQSAAPREDEQE